MDKPAAYFLPPTADGLALSRVVARNTVVQIVGRGGTLLFSLAAVMLLTRHLGVEGVGEYLLIVSLLTLLNFSDMGLFVITVRELSVGKEDANELLGNVIILRIATGLASMAMVAAVTLSLGYPREVTVAVLLGSLSYLAIAVGSGSLGAALVANLRMEFQVLANLAQSIVFISLVGVVVAADLGLVPLVIVYNASVLVNSLVVIACARRFTRPKLRVDLGLWRRISVAALPAGVNTIAWILYSRIDMVLLSKMKDAEAVGLYGVCYRFVDMAWPIGFFFVGSVYPILSRYHNDGDRDRLRRLMQRSVDILALIALAPVAILFVFAEPILRIVGSGDFVAATTSLRILAVAIVPLWLGMFCSYTVLAIDRQMSLLWIGLAALAVNIGINLALIPSLSYEGSAIATLATEAAALTLMAVVIASDLRFLPSLSTMARIAVPLSIAAAIAAFLFNDSIPVQAAIVAGGIGVSYGFSGAISVRDLRALLERDSNPSQLGNEIGAGT